MNSTINWYKIISFSFSVMQKIYSKTVQLKNSNKDQDTLIEQSLILIHCRTVNPEFIILIE